MIDEVEQALVRPVEILEHEHERPLLGEPLEVAPPRGERLASGRPRLPRPRPTSGSRWRTTHARSCSSTVSATDARSLAVASSSASFSWIPACALTISPSAQKLTPAPYGRARPWRHQISSGSFSSRWKSSRDEPRLADARDARRASRAAARAHARTRSRASTSTLELALAADERRERLLLEIHRRPARVHCTGSQTRIGSDLPFAWTASRAS